MNKIQLLLIISGSLYSCALQEYVVDYHYNYQGDFNKYKSYDFVVDESFEGTSSNRLTFEKSLSTILNAWGYKQNQRKPDLYIYYSVYFDDLKFTAHVQPEFDEWMVSEFGRKRVEFANDTTQFGSEYQRVYSQDEKYDQNVQVLKEGTFMITMVDARKNIAVWQGYSSGRFGTKDQLDERYIRYNIKQILDEFRVLAFEHS
jgi:hypothetical protein